MKATSMLAIWVWTCAGVALLVLLFSANIATVGVIHQLGWMARGPMVKNSCAEAAQRLAL